MNKFILIINFLNVLHVSFVTGQANICMDSIPTFIIEKGLTNQAQKYIDYLILDPDVKLHNNGQIRYCFNWDSSQNLFNFTEYFSNGKIRERGSFNLNAEKNGIWDEFYVDGNLKLQRNFCGKYDCLINYWNENGVQTLINGNGFMTYEEEHGYRIWKHEYYYSNCLKNGVQKTYINGILGEEREMKEGKNNGKTTIRYPNGELRAIIQYEMDSVISIKEYSLSNNVKCKLKFRYFYNSKYTDLIKLPKDGSFPICINESELTYKLSPPLVLLNNPNSNPYAIFYLTLSKSGKVKQIESGGSYMFSGDTIVPIVKEMQFKPMVFQTKAKRSKIDVLIELEIQ